MKSYFKSGGKGKDSTTVGVYLTSTQPFIRLWITLHLLSPFTALMVHNGHPKWGIKKKNVTTQFYLQLQKPVASASDNILTTSLQILVHST